MYQGKFLSENKTAKGAPQPKKAAAVPTADEIIDEELAAQEQPVKEVPAPEAVEVTEAPKKKKKRGIRVGTIIFYLLYLMLIGAAAYGIDYGLGLLNDWLTVYEASQPDTRSQEIFDEIFADPDWGKIYDMAGLQGTQFEGKDAYVTYMESKVGGSELTFSKTSAGLSGGQKYIVKLGEEKVATFTMQNPITDELEIPQWSLDQVEAGFFTRDQDVTVLTQPGRTVTLNGVPLDESYIVKTTSSVVENYLPEGVHGQRTAMLYAKGFLVAPEVLVIDENGVIIEMEYDAETNTYSESLLANPASDEISDDAYNALLDAVYAYSKAMIGADKENWPYYFDRTTDFYDSLRRLISNDSFFKGWTRYNFEEETVSEYHRYTEGLFSARIQVVLNTYRPDGSVKPFEVNTTVFMTKDDSGKWLISNMVNSEVHTILTQVRLTWMQDGEILASEMVDASTNFLTPPAVTAPEGQEFIGWFTESTDSDGNVTISRVFAPTESGTISLAEEYVLEPMVLQARFEAKGE